MRMQQIVLSIVTLALSATAAFAGGDTEFTYQGRLLVAGEPANGTFNVDFSLWDAPAAGNQIDVTNTFNSLPILEGQFTAELNFGASAFDNNDRWLEITVDGVPLVPRQPITRTPYAIQTRGIFVDNAGNIGIGTTAPFYPLHVESNGGSGIFAQNTATSGTTYGGRFEIESTSGAGVSGRATALTGSAPGVSGTSLSSSGVGVFGSGNFGGRFESDSTSGRGVFGYASATTGTGYGGWFQSNSTSGTGVYGWANAGTGTNYGGRFKSQSTSGFAGYFDGKGNDAVYVENTGGGRGLQAVAPSDTAVWGRTTTGFAGVHGENAAATGRGVYGQASDTSGTNYGVYGRSDSASGFDFYAGGAGVNYGASSSRRWKNNVVPIGDPLAKLSKLQGVYFDWDGEHGGAHDVGMIAEEVGAVLPEIVQYRGERRRRHRHGLQQDDTDTRRGRQCSSCGER